MTKPAEPSTPSGPSATTMKATDHELQKYDNFTRYGQVWPGKLGACRKLGAAANLDSSCARRRQRTAGRDKETGFEIEQRN
jgi:hypothetical protein